MKSITLRLAREMYEKNNRQPFSFIFAGYHMTIMGAFGNIHSAQDVEKIDKVCMKATTYEAIE